ncbi:circularly permuted type 2 ATP-grasp protein [Celeribacter halophilus]|uniref:Circularly permuted type 2 ATP-grasp protein n=1 Tax=Celeribacter halophilus TaxID=576117 RepID=A0AAW7XXQ8_9RHOB|nr:circularly permuted type 2 ATP-grasp protein [Celeribacter halophilus]MDO6457732.1 circularly permuted type 2 ATP-grasp protein [Celeribacter halophilus]MDO6723990.1 circularly permuted type 2 ATP-grasp protein [Celeribacter halophilus]
MSQRLPTGSATPDLFAAYRQTPDVADELFDATGRMRPVWRRFVDRFTRLSQEEIHTRFERGDQYLRDAGVFYRQYSNDPLTERAWPLSHIPVILHEQEWDHICAGLAQRADLLEQVMADLYGPARLVTEGHLPADLIARSPQWLRPMVGVKPVGGHYLHFLAFEIGRSPDGSWFVLGDRTQAPSGAGFALENRMATGRIFPERFPRAHIHKLAGFFGAFRDAMEDLASASSKRPRVTGIMTPGPSNDTYYEHTYIARYLGMMLLEGEDIVVENGEAMVRTIEGLQPLGLLWRRIDASFADPLEFDARSQIGTPGLMEAVRTGHLAMANALGSGVLEMRAMMAFLPRISKVLTGAPLDLPNIATWWCGGRAERAYVRDNAQNMLISPADAVDLPFDLDATTALGGEFRGAPKGSIAEWLDSEGDNLVGQEAVTLSTTPSWDESAEGGAVVPRPMTVRVFAARTASGWQFMKGGYARIGRSGDATALAMQRGGSVADVWVVSDRPLPKTGQQLPDEGDFLRSSPGWLPARAADNLFWLGRYLERFEDAARLVRAYHLRLAATDNRNDPRLKSLHLYLAGYGVDLDQTLPEALIARVISARACATKVRDRFSSDGLAALNDLLKTASRMTATVQPGDDCARAMSVLIRKIAGITGLVHENMYRSAGWRFLSFGRALERADAMAALLAQFADAQAPEGSLDLAVEVGDSVITHQRRYRVETSRNAVIDLMALDADNPRAILFLIRAMRIHAQALPRASLNGRPSELLRTILPLEARLTCAHPDEITSDDLQGIRAELADVSDLLSSIYLR